jgi:hypothetical protein
MASLTSPHLTQSPLFGVQCPYAAQLRPRLLLSHRCAPTATSFRGTSARLALLSCRAVPPAAGQLVVSVNPMLDAKQNQSLEAVSAAETVADAAVGPVTAAPAAQHQAPIPVESPAAPAATPHSPQDRRKLWFAAIKPPMYSVGFIPVLVSHIRRAAFFDTVTRAQESFPRID